MTKHRINWKFWLFLLLTLGWVGFIFARSARTAALSSAESGAVLALLRRILPDLTDHAVRKLAHFTEFFLLGGLLFLTAAAAKRPRFWTVPLFGGLTAVADEVLQHFVPGRSCQLSDMLLDLSGVLTALGLLLLLRRLKNRRHSA